MRPYMEHPGWWCRLAKPMRRMIAFRSRRSCGSAIVVAMVGVLTAFNESTVENAALELFRELGYEYLHGQAIAPGAETAERESFEQVVLTRRLRDAVLRLNPGLPPAVYD